MKLTSEQELAEQVLRIKPEKAAELRRTKKWPHVRLGRFDIRYTDEQVAEVVRLMSQQGSGRTVAIPGQTTRSRKRAS